MGSAPCTEVVRGVARACVPDPVPVRGARGRKSLTPLRLGAELGER